MEVSDSQQEQPLLLVEPAEAGADDLSDLLASRCRGLKVRSHLVEADSIEELTQLVAHEFDDGVLKPNGFAGEPLVASVLARLPTKRPDSRIERERSRVA